VKNVGLEVNAQEGHRSIFNKAIGEDQIRVLSSYLAIIKWKIALDITNQPCIINNFLIDCKFGFRLILC